MSDNKKVSGSMLAYAIDKMLDLLDDKADQTDLEATINSAKEYADERFFVITCELGERNESPVYPLTNLNRSIDEIFNYVYSAPTDYAKLIVLRVSAGGKMHDLRLVSYENNTLYFGAIDGNGVYVACIDYNNTPWFGSDVYLTSSAIEDQIASGHMAAPTSNAVYNAIESHNAATNAHEDIRNALNTKANASDLATKQDNLTTLTWSPSTLPSNSTWKAVAYGNGMFVAIANDSNKTAYSTDGEHWTETTNLPSESSWYSVTYGNGKFVAVAYGTVAAYSTDGITWTAATLPSSRNWRSVAYGNGMFVAIAGSSNVTAYSTDGINWQLSDITVGVSWESVAYGNGMFVAIENGTNVAAYSTDGITWTAGTLPQSTRWRSLTYGNGRFVAVAYNTSIAAYSTDGIHWTESTLPTTTYWCSVAYGNGMFVVVTYNKTISAYSTDGVNWIEITLPHSSYGFAATYGNGIFAAVGYSTDRAVYAKTPAVLVSGFESDVKGIVDEAITAAISGAIGGSY